MSTPISSRAPASVTGAWSSQPSVPTFSALDDAATCPTSLASRPLVTHAVLAEFDVDAGAIVRAQVPEPVPGLSPAMLADQMLPDGTHARVSDWSVLRLARDPPPAPGLPRARRLPHPRCPAAFAPYFSATPPAGPAHAYWSITRSPSLNDDPRSPLLCLTLVHTRKDPAARRGAVCRALALVCRHRWHWALRAVLSAALPLVFDLPDSALAPALQALLDDVNAAFLTHYFALLQERERALRAAPALGRAHTHTAAWLGAVAAHGGALSGLGAATADAPAGAGALPDATQGPLAGCARGSTFAVFFPRLAALIGAASLTPVPVTVPWLLAPDAVLEASAYFLLTLVTPAAALAAVAAAAAQRRVVVLGFQRPAHEVARAVAAVTALAGLGPARLELVFAAAAAGTDSAHVHALATEGCGGPDDALEATARAAEPFAVPGPSLLHRTYPYTSLTDLSFLRGQLRRAPAAPHGAVFLPALREGFVAGATNPLFESRPQWWDVLLDLTTGTARDSALLRVPASGANGLPPIAGPGGSVHSAIKGDVAVVPDPPAPDHNDSDYWYFAALARDALAAAAGPLGAAAASGQYRSARSSNADALTTDAAAANDDDGYNGGGDDDDAEAEDAAARAGGYGMRVLPGAASPLIPLPPVAGAASTPLPDPAAGLLRRSLASAQAAHAAALAPPPPPSAPGVPASPTLAVPAVHPVPALAAGAVAATAAAVCAPLLTAPGGHVRVAVALPEADTVSVPLAPRGQGALDGSLAHGHVAAAALDVPVAVTVPLGAAAADADAPAALLPLELTRLAHYPRLPRALLGAPTATHAPANATTGANASASATAAAAASVDASASNAAAASAIPRSAPPRLSVSGEG